MSKIIDLQYNLANGENIQYIHIDEYLAIRREQNNYVVHCQIRYGSELETHIIEALIEAETANKLEYLQINTVGGNKSFKYPLNLADFGDVHFPKLKSLIIPEQSLYMQTYIYDGFTEGKENGVISNILNNCPSLKILVLPCYPDNNFRNVKLPKLQTLRIINKEQPDKFFKTLTQTPKKNFPNLEVLQVSQLGTEEIMDKFLSSPIGKNLKGIYL